jgi:threonine/homoserine/homoserine lactone efflux protein
MTSILAAALIGYTLGFVGSVPLTGPIALLVFNRGLQGRVRKGVAVGVGGAFGESAYIALAVTGVGALVEAYPMAAAGLKAMSAVILVAFGLYFLIKPPSDQPTGEGETVDDDGWGANWGTEFVKGFTVSAFNPILLLNWTAAVALVYSMTGMSLALDGQITFAIAATLGVATWFALLAVILGEFREQLAERTIQWLQRGMGAIVLAAAALPIHDILSSLTA